MLEVELALNKSCLINSTDKPYALMIDTSVLARSMSNIQVSSIVGRCVDFTDT